MEVTAVTDYISREAAVKAAQDGADKWDGGFNRNRDSYIECAIDLIPAADVVEVVHGKWRQDKQGKWRCSVCKAGNNYAYAWVLQDNYCPNCGAKMRPTSMSGTNGGAENG